MKRAAETVPASQCRTAALLPPCVWHTENPMGFHISIAPVARFSIPPLHTNALTSAVLPKRGASQKAEKKKESHQQTPLFFPGSSLVKRRGFFLLSGKSVLCIRPHAHVAAWGTLVPFIAGG